MDKEMLMILAMACGGTLFAIGGTGFKWARRYILPLVLGILTKIGGKSWHKCLAFMASLMVALHLPYGEKTPYIVKFLVFSAMFGSTCFLGWSWWQAMGILATFILFKISNTRWGQNIVFHKAWEFITGSLIGITIASLITGR